MTDTRTKQMSLKHAEHLARELNARWPHKDAEYQAVAKPDGTYKIEIRRLQIVPDSPIKCNEGAEGVCIHDKALGGLTLQEFVAKYVEASTRRQLLERELEDARKAHAGTAALLGDRYSVADRIRVLEAELALLPRLS